MRARRRFTARLLVLLTAASLGTATTVDGPTARARPSEPPALVAAEDTTAPMSPGEQAATYPDGLSEAIRRDLETDPRTYAVRAVRAAAAAETAEELRESLGDRFGGAWFDPDDGGLNVAVTSQAAAETARAAGARTHLRGLDARRLSEAADRVRDWVSELPVDQEALVHAVGVSSRTSTVELTVVNSPTGRELAARAPEDDVRVSVRVADHRPHPQLDLFGWDGITSRREDGGAGRPCSLGFNALDAVGRATSLTAGHCGHGGASQVRSRRDGSLIGIFEAVFWDSLTGGGRGHDHAVVRITDPRYPMRPGVTDQRGDTLPVETVAAPIEGMPVCVVGQASGWECGTIDAVEVDVRVDDLAGGLHRQLTFQHDACTASGDSGAPVLSGTAAIGLHSAGTTTPGGHRCPTGVARTAGYAQPLATSVLPAHDDELRILTTSDDSDGDGVPDHIELADDPTAVRDENGDGVPAYLDPDEPQLRTPVVTFPEDGSRHTDRLLPLIGTAKPSAEVTVEYRGTRTTTVARTDGSWRIDPEEELPLGRYELAVSQFWTAPNGSEWQSGLVMTSFVVSPPEPEISAPVTGWQTTNSRPVIAGTGTPGADVSVSVDGHVVGVATVGGDGHWSVTPAEPLPDGARTVTVEQEVDSVLSQPTTGTLTVVGSGNVPPPEVHAGPEGSAVAKHAEPRVVEGTQGGGSQPSRFVDQAAEGEDDGLLRFLPLLTVAALALAVGSGLTFGRRRREGEDNVEV
ncbi:Ig-like domain-containing protein [Actinoalloteichus caeruleus]|uniref:V8-like Glu-specific endopeptidase n=1 Tax=Actinoalloteichus caeruleus DSM 43889 TaxID=1120930 RepID=A0ABT1JJY6_ACTCY|nr:Ig-like domain-containing protein [Actinoalloteichus caeruleus]MCP2332657.1 V8-like Glu-specific endopeptidase [Actinoalloteichus caeruleus DSM 43889]